MFAGLRAYAVSGRNKWVLTIVLILGFINPVVYMVRLADLSRPIETSFTGNLQVIYTLTTRMHVDERNLRALTALDAFM